MTFITADEARNASGVPSTLISDTQLDEFIGFVESEMARWLNTAFVPTQVIETRDGNNTYRMFTRKNPLLSVRALTVNRTTTITPAYIYWNKPSGKVELGSSAESATFTEGVKNTYIKYLYGMLEESSTTTTTSTASTAGTSVTLSVASITGFADEDWVEIYGMDGNREVAQISGDPTGTSIVVDKLVQAHESESIVAKLQIPDYIKRYMLIEVSICAAINAIGATYTFNASYSLGELSVTKGVPYVHWDASMRKLLEERRMRKSRIKPRPAVMV